MYINIDLFEKKLCRGLVERVMQFAKYMREEFKKNPDQAQVKTNVEWVEEFKKWKSIQQQLEDTILKYMKECEE